MVACLAAVLATTALWRRERRRRLVLEQAERMAIERRDRLLAMISDELEGALTPLRGSLQALERTPGPAGARAALRELDELKTRVVGVGRGGPAQPARRAPSFEDVELAELVREIVDAPPFSDEGPPVI